MIGILTNEASFRILAADTPEEIKQEIDRVRRSLDAEYTE